MIIHFYLFHSYFKLSGLAMCIIGLWLKVDPDVSEYLEIVDGDEGMNTIHRVGLSMMIIGAAILVTGLNIAASDLSEGQYKSKSHLHILPSTLFHCKIIC